MPPRTVKRGGAASASKRKAGAQKSQQPQQQVQEYEPVVEEAAMLEEKIIVVKEDDDEVKADEKSVDEDKSVVEEKSIVEEKTILGDHLAIASDADRKSDANGSVHIKKEDEVKDSVDEYERDECIDLEDNDPEYEPEEFGEVDYGDKEIEQAVVQEVEQEIEGDPDDILSEDGDMDEEEVEEFIEELEVGEDDEHIDKENEHEADHERDHENDHLEHTGIVDAEAEEQHDVVKERRKRKELEIFIGGLDKDATEDDLRKVFSSVGEVTEIRLMMNPQTKKNKGFAFVRFATVEQAKLAVTELKKPMINGKQCGVNPSQDSDTLFLGNICKTWTKEYLKEKLKHYGVDSPEDITLVEDGKNEGMNRGFAFVEFSSRSDAMNAFKRLQKRDVIFGVDRPAKVSFADSFINPGDEIMLQVKTVFIDGLSASWDEDHVKEFLKKYGEIEKIELARNMPAAKRRDFGFVTFDSHDAAVTCAKSINNTELGEGGSKANVRARLSRPLQRGFRGKHVGGGDYHSTHAVGRSVSRSWTRHTSHSLPSRQVRSVPARVPPSSLKRPVGVRGRRPLMSMPIKSRPLPPPRAYNRRPTVPSYPKSSMKKDYGRREELPPPRSRTAADYVSRIGPERHPSYRESYPDHGPVYSDLPRSTSITAPRRGYVDDVYEQRFERQHLPPPTRYRERGRNYDTMPGSKRPYSAIDDVPPRYANPNVRQSRAQLDYDYTGRSSQFSDAYNDRFSRSNFGYNANGRSMSGQESHGMGVSREGMGYGEDSYGGSDVGMYSSSYGSDYMPRGSDVGGGSYSSMYPGRGMNRSSYMGSGSGSYY